MGCLIFFYYFYNLVLRQKQQKLMIKNNFYQVKLIQNPSVTSWCFFSYINFGNSAIVRQCNSFLRIINPFINKNLYYENKF